MKLHSIAREVRPLEERLPVQHNALPHQSTSGEEAGGGVPISLSLPRDLLRVALCRPFLRHALSLRLPGLHLQGQEQV